MLKTCNYTTQYERKYGRDCCFQLPKSSIHDNEHYSEEVDEPNSFSTAFSSKHKSYSPVAYKQMVGIFSSLDEKGACSACKWCQLDMCCGHSVGIDQAFLAVYMYIHVVIVLWCSYFI